MLKHHTMSTPAGPLTVMVSDAGAVRAAGFTTEIGDLMPLIHASLRDKTEPADDIGPIAIAISSYFDGDLTAIDEVPVEQHTAGPFTARAWKVMRDIKPGSPVTYSEFAQMAGQAQAVRAAAAACANNPVAFFTPCHRVLGRDGTLRGYRWGLPVKRWLLDFEAH